MALPPPPPTQLPSAYALYTGQAIKLNRWKCLIFLPLSLSHHCSGGSMWYGWVFTGTWWSQRKEPITQPTLTASYNWWNDSITTVFMSSWTCTRTVGVLSSVSHMVYRLSTHTATLPTMTHLEARHTHSHCSNPPMMHRVT